MTQEALKMALEALEGFIPYLPLKDEAQCNRYDKAITTIKEALAQRTWVGLEGEEIRKSWEEATKPDRSTMTMITSFARAIEAKLKQKNGYAEEKNT